MNKNNKSKNILTKIIRYDGAVILSEAKNPVERIFLKNSKDFYVLLNKMSFAGLRVASAPAFAGITYLIFFIILFNFLSLKIIANTTQAPIDTVNSFKPGSGQNQGQSLEYFPKNIFGLPDTTARYEFAATSPEQICSIGLGGEIIVGFKGRYIIDEPGPDFTIFENAFLNPVTNKIFAEPAKVAVSSDGINFIEFPYDSLTLKECAGVTPTNGNKNPFNPDESGGDSFDIGKLGLKYIKYIKITDISSMVLNNKKHPFYDPTISGFDLDAVVGLHLAEHEVNNVNENINNDITVFSSNGKLLIKNLSNANNTIQIFKLNGDLILSDRNIEKDLSIPGLANGLYLILISQDNRVMTKKVVINE